MKEIETMHVCEWQNIRRICLRKNRKAENVKILKLNETNARKKDMKKQFQGEVKEHHLQIKRLTTLKMERYYLTMISKKQRKWL